MRFLIVLPLLMMGCVGSTEQPAPKEAPTMAHPPSDRPSTAQGSQLDPARVCDRSACGTVSDMSGQPIAKAWLRVIRSDDVVDEKSTLNTDGRWVLHMREENSGPRPWKLMFGAPGYVEQTVDVPDPLPIEGFKIDAKLHPAK